MLYISEQGHVDAERIQLKLFATIERGPMLNVHGIVVHQTGGATASSTFNSYQNVGANGAHFLIDRDGDIYQTASLTRVTHHVGRIRSRCLETVSCTPVAIAESRRALRRGGVLELDRHERNKAWPARFPSNSDAIGIELVGMYRDSGKEQVYEAPTPEQNVSLSWLIAELIETLRIERREVYRHPEVSYKNATEASAARW
ncbi:peptidoglycan recognition family protein [Caballeronia sp. LZ035]|uniref:peptidoglycan recognition protein family protein n=1 Tax=Caballeronia sp. LZ035 TaxID=3038568 RepID=UPI00285E7D77|nr:peptidoglycan recognition family protein [Caballeronia sp. LZ035]MDR5762551.1 peptidoglycan recognition family protein [Caballeronia sp. LZ035]